jgi:cell division protein FtsB
LETENNLLKDRKYVDLSHLQTEKIRLSMAYEEQVKILAQKKDDLKKLSPVQQDEIRTLATRFDDVVAENIRLLASACAISEKVMEAIRDAVQEKTEQHTGYGNMLQNRFAPNAKKRESMAPVSLNQTL